VGAGATGAAAATDAADAAVCKVVVTAVAVVVAGAGAGAALGAVTVVVKLRAPGESTLYEVWAGRGVDARAVWPPEGTDANSPTPAKTVVTKAAWRTGCRRARAHAACPCLPAAVRAGVCGGTGSGVRLISTMC
jgi:hypothetical protein